MSSLVFVGGVLDLGRASAVARFRQERLRALPGPVEALGGAPAFGSVAEALASTSECGRFLRIALEGACVLVEAAVSDDWQDAWLPTLGGVAMAAAHVGATGTLVVTEESGAFGGRVQVRPGDARFDAVTDPVALARLIDDPLLAGALQRLAGERGVET